MKMKSVLLLAVALGCGLVAMLGVQQVLKRDKPKAEVMGKVLRATTHISPGEPLDEKNTAFKEMQADQIPEGAVTRASEMEDRAVMYATVPGEVIMLAKLGDKGSYRPTAEIPEGMRVFTCSVDTTKAHSNLIRPGDHVDVVVTYKALHSGRQVQRAKTMLQYIQVFATDNLRQSGTSTDTGDTGMKNVSLLVKPDQYNLCVLAQKMGEVTLAMRSNGDDNIVEVASVDERFFEDAVAGEGDGSDNPLIARDRKFLEEDGPPNAEPVAGDVRKFLQEQQTAAPAAPAAPTKWMITIYEGEQVRVAEVDLPEETEPAGSSLPGGINIPGLLNFEQAPAPAGPAASSSMKGWMKTLLQGA